MRALCPALLVFINALFVWKYGARANLGAISTIVFVLAMSIGIAWFHRLPDRLCSKWVRYGYLLLFILALLVAWHLVPQATVRVDRWSSIPAFLDYLFAGKFPYAARTHLGNGLSYFPFYFVLALPFYFLREIGWMSVAAVLAYDRVTTSIAQRERLLAIVLVTAMPVMLWEFTVRSTLFFNAVAFLVFLHYAGVHGPQRKWSSTLLFGALAGLLLSTRAVFGLALLAYVGHAYLRERQYYRGLVFLALSGTVLALTLVPFALWDWGSFLANNPLTVQAGFLPRLSLPFLAALAILLGYYSTGTRDLYRAIGVLLFIGVAGAFLDALLGLGFDRALAGNGFDISYFVLCVPFLAMAVQLPLLGSRSGEVTSS